MFLKQIDFCNMFYVIKAQMLQVILKILQKKKTKTIITIYFENVKFLPC